MREPDEANQFLAAHAALLLSSYRRLTGRDLLPPDSAPAAARALYHAPFAVLSHDGTADPAFTYANRTAQRLFEMPWSEIVGLPSRYSAEPLARDERQRLLQCVARQGYIDDYQGVRISRNGRRFLIRRATVWNLVAGEGSPAGQAATFSDWLPLDKG
jgi:PAS domain-containing protein